MKRIAVRLGTPREIVIFGKFIVALVQVSRTAKTIVQEHRYALYKAVLHRLAYRNHTIIVIQQLRRGDGRLLAAYRVDEHVHLISPSGKKAHRLL